MSGKNPRTGIGVVEPGHFVLIVADGRQKDYAIGLSLVDFANLFKEEGCVSAYNLDGGVSAAMVFMGEHLNTHLNIKDYSQQRNLPDALLFGHTLLLPDENDPAPEFTGIRTGADDQLIIAPQNPSYYHP
jgi:exopolysaccharide biosynthesis protein